MLSLEKRAFVRQVVPLQPHRPDIRVIEVPLNSPDPFLSIAAFARHTGPSGSLIGAGTELTLEDAKRTHAAGGRVAVAANCDADGIREALRLGMALLPGVATATETLAAHRAGVTQLKLFPAVSLRSRHIKALAAVLPAGRQVFPVGGSARTICMSGSRQERPALARRSSNPITLWRGSASVRSAHWPRRTAVLIFLKK